MYADSNSVQCETLSKKDPIEVNVPSTFDALLGPSKSRYFGDGHRKVFHRIKKMSTSGDICATSISGQAQADYPLTWSVAPNGSPRVPHVSSVDGVAISALSLDELSRTTPGAEWLGQATIDRVTLTTRPAPATTTTTTRRILIDADALNLASPKIGTTVDLTIQVGSLRVTLTVRAGEPVAVDRPVERLSPYEHGFRLTRNQSEIVEYDRAGQTIRAHHRYSFGHSRATGIDSAAWPLLTHVDNLVLCGQLAQILVFATAEVDRGSIENLWMRSAILQRREPTSSQHDFMTTAHITQSAQIQRGSRTFNSFSLTAISEHGLVASARFGFINGPDAQGK